MLDLPPCRYAHTLASFRPHWQYFHGMDEAVFRNINACRELTRVTRSSYGPNGKAKAMSGQPYHIWACLDWPIYSSWRGGVLLHRHEQDRDQPS